MPLPFQQNHGGKNWCFFYCHLVMFIGKGLEALDWDTSEAAGWLRVEADGGGSWLVPPQALKPFFQQNL